MADWLKVLEEQARLGDEMRRDVPKMLADPAISVEQVKALFAALEQQAEFVEKLKAALEGPRFRGRRQGHRTGGPLRRSRGVCGGEAEGDAGVGQSRADFRIGQTSCFRNSSGTGSPSMPTCSGQRPGGR